MKFIALQEPLRPIVPTVLGNVDYLRFQDELTQIDTLLALSGIESEFVEKSLTQYVAHGVANGAVAQAGDLTRHETHAITVLRSMILIRLLGESFRGMSRRLAECPLFRWFCRIETIGPVSVPGKSALQEYAQWIKESDLREIVGTLLRAAGDGQSALQLANNVELERVWIDSTAIECNIHFPVDWLLMRDAVRTLMKATKLIRKHGLKVRMEEEPLDFLSAINGLSIQMAQNRRKQDAKRQRKQTLRLMKRLVKVVQGHAARHRDLLDKEWEKTDWTRKQAEQVLRRIDNILEQLPAAQKQAHERIIGERQVKSSEKILSLYEHEVRVIVRGKAGAEVEFGNTLLLAEQENGLLLDWRLYSESAPADSRLLPESVQRIEAVLKVKLKAAVTDRGFDSAKNSALLEEKEIFNAVCPKSPLELKAHLQDRNFVLLQKRRASTEGRIGIFKNVFVGTPLRAKGFARREIAIAWNVLVHNLWVLARLPLARQLPQALAA